MRKRKPPQASPPYSVPWLILEERRWIAEGFRQIDRLLSAHAAFERFYEARSFQAPLPPHPSERGRPK